MATTCKLIAKVSLGSDAANIDFTSIPGTYTDLMLVASLRSKRASPQVLDNIKIEFNGSSSNFSYRRLVFENTTVTSDSDTTNLIPIATALGATASTFSSAEIYIPNYAGSTNKSFSSTGLAETNAAAAQGWIGAHLWSNTAAITSLLIKTNTGLDLASGSSAFLYGITKA